MYIIKIKGKAKIPDYIQIRNENMILIDYFRADRPVDKLKSYGLTSSDKKIVEYINKLDFGKLQKLNLQ